MRNAPSIGGGIFLAVVGAILAFAVGPQAIGGINLQTIGYICMVAGAIMVVLGLVLGSSRSAPRAVQRTETVQRGTEAPTIRETRTETD